MAISDSGAGNCTSCKKCKICKSQDYVLFIDKNLARCTLMSMVIKLIKPQITKQNYDLAQQGLRLAK